EIPDEFRTDPGHQRLEGPVPAVLAGVQAGLPVDDPADVARPRVAQHEAAPAGRGGHRGRRKGFHDPMIGPCRAGHRRPVASAPDAPAGAEHPPDDAQAGRHEGQRHAGADGD
ncbi:hypothetical protein RZS08_39285, partial [Arthrospira platensis SPKY1]|nr:hypothetical protein [Arthrospira platensis SPKY1]